MYPEEIQGVVVKILISTLGSRGDIQPYLALAVGLQHAGHHATLATSDNFADWIRSHGVNVHPTHFSVQEFMQKPETQATLKSGNPVRQFRMMREVMSQSVEALDDVWQAAQEADFVVQSGTGGGALEAASKRGVPAAFAYVIPFAPTRAFPSFFSDPIRLSLGGGYNYLTHILMHQVLWSGLGGPLTNGWRKCLGLRPWRSYGEMLAYGRRLGTPLLYGFSPSVLPRPADWDAHQHITGYWFLETEPSWEPPADLWRFLEGGPPPVYVGLGSLSLGDSEGKTRLVLRALELSGQRGVLLTGWGGLSRRAAPPNVFFVEDAPHAWLFPRMAAVVHHGGAGTTGAGLRAGVPNIITPIAGDQYAWADVVVKLGVGPRAPEIKKLTAEKLAQAIDTAVNDSAMRARATALGEKIRAENGVARAVDIIERHATKVHSGMCERFS
jgi:UDP:flavonoid glycosyltransferase YjiC (YdhE family)